MSARFIPTIASQSLGRAWHHSLEHKLSLCQQYGFESIELFFEDLDAVAQSLPVSHPPSSPGTSFAGSTDVQERQLAAAAYVHELCLDHRLGVLCIQPFMHYEGRLDPLSHQAAIQDLHFWIRQARILGTDLIQIPSSFLPPTKCTGSRDILVAELREAADIGLSASPPIRFAYEALAWGTHIDTWDAAWSIVLEVDRPNFGTCIDTFNLAGRVFADPASPTRLTPNAFEDIQRSIAKIRSELSLAIDKVFYVEVCDGERMETPLVPGHEWYNPEQPPRMSWSRNARLFPFEKPGYLPVLEILEAVCEAGYTGHISFELFSRTANQPEEAVAEQHAKRAASAWNKLAQYMRWNSPPAVSEDGYRTSVLTDAGMNNQNYQDREYSGPRL